MKILHLGKKGNVEKYLPHQEYLKGIELVDLPITASIEEILNKASDARYLIADAIAPVPGELIRKMPQLKMIHSEGVAYNFFDIEAAKESGRVVKSVEIKTQAPDHPSLLCADETHYLKFYVLNII